MPPSAMDIGLLLVLTNRITAYRVDRDSNVTVKRFRVRCVLCERIRFGKTAISFNRRSRPVCGSSRQRSVSHAARV